MAEKDRLIDAFGELIYALAIADGAVQEVEILTLEKILRGHPWAGGIKWSFNYEHQKNHSLQEAYAKAIDTFKEHGPAPEYEYLLEILDAIARAFEGTTPEESQVMQQFKNDLRQQFLKDLEEHNLKTW